MFGSPQVTRSDLGGVGVVATVGEIDLAWAQQLRDNLEAAITESDARVVVDLADTTFVDSSTIGTFVAAAKLAKSRGGWLRLASAHGQVEHVLTLTQVGKLLGMYDDVATAIDGDPATPGAREGG